MKVSSGAGAAKRKQRDSKGATIFRDPEQQDSELDPQNGQARRQLDQLK
jgi:hypothetical protein